MFAIVEITGHQYKVEKGMKLEVQKLVDTKVGDKIKIDKVLLKSDGKTTEVGQPYVSGSMVEIEVKEHGKGDKIRVFKKQPKKRFMKTQGHRQQYTQVEVLSVK